MEPYVRTALMVGVVLLILLSVLAMLRTGRRYTGYVEDLLSTKSQYDTADYDADSKCDICFDDIGEENVIECLCGKKFHFTCADLTGECPYCGRVAKDFLPPRKSRRVTCPRCGEPITGNICTCGIIIPDPDGTFECRCGERISVGESMCHKCGRGFSSRITPVKKGFIPHGR